VSVPVARLSLSPCVYLLLSQTTLTSVDNPVHLFTVARFSTRPSDATRTTRSDGGCRSLCDALLDRAGWRRWLQDWELHRGVLQGKLGTEQWCCVLVAFEWKMVSYHKLAFTVRRKLLGLQQQRVWD